MSKDRDEIKKQIESARIDFVGMKAQAELGIKLCDNILDMIRRERPDDEIHAVIAASVIMQ